MFRWARHGYAVRSRGRALDQGRELAAYLNARGIQSVRFVPIVFTPSSSNFAGERCEGVNLIILDRNTLDSPSWDRAGLGAAQALSE
jgi:hypothetical protein